MIFQRSGVYKASQELLSKPCKSIKYCSDTEPWIIQCSKSRALDLVKGSNLVVNTSLCPGRQLTAIIRKHVFYQLQKLIIKPCRVTGWENNNFTSQH